MLYRIKQVAIDYWWLLIPIVFFIFFRFTLGFQGLYGQDSYEYVRYTEALTTFFRTGQNPGDYCWPINYPLFSSFFNLVFSVSIACQLVSFFSFLGICILIKKIMKHLYISATDFEINIFIITTVLFSPYFFRGGILCMSDMLNAFFITVIFYSFLKLKENVNYIFLLSIVAGFSICTRYASALILMPFCFMGYYFLVFNKRKIGITLLSIILGLITFIPQYYFKTNATSAFVSHEFISTWSFSNFFSFDFATNDGTAKNNVFNLIYISSVFFHPGYLLAGIPILIGFRKESFKGLQLILLCTILLYLFFLAGIPFQNMRFLIIIFPLVIVYMFQPFVVAQRLFPKYIIILASLGLILIQTCVFVYSFGKVYSRSKVEKEIASYFLLQNENKIIYGYSFDVPLPYYGVKQPLKNLFVEKYESFEKGSFVLFNPNELKNKLEGRNPVLNWNLMNTQNTVVSIKKFSNGWEVYEIR
jgi:hypothetical protein